MSRSKFSRFSAVLFFLALLGGALFCMFRLADDIHAQNYFVRESELKHEIIFLTSYILIILFVLRYGYYLAVNRVGWKEVKDDYIFLLNKKYFSRTQWILNILLFWFSLIGFIYSLALSAMKGDF